MNRLNKLTNKQQGFTLIELVVVIVILGILAVTAAPKFIDLTSDAKASVVEAVRGSINSAADLAHAKALVAGETAQDGAISVANTTIDLTYGWPDETSIAALLELDDDIEQVSGSEGTFTHVDATTPADCVAVYDMEDVDSAEVRPSITSTVTGC